MPLNLDTPINYAQTITAYEIDFYSVDDDRRELTISYYARAADATTIQAKMLTLVGPDFDSAIAAANSYLTGMSPPNIRAATALALYDAIKSHEAVAGSVVLKLMPTTVTKTIKPSGGDYTTLSGWEANEQADIVTADEAHVAEISHFPGGLDDAMILSGWTTDATRDITIKAASADAHAGTWDTSKVYIENATNPTGDILRTQNVGWVTVKDLQFLLNAANAVTSAYESNGPSSASDVFFERNIIKGGAITGAGGAPDAVYINENIAGADDFYISNCVIFDIKNSDFPDSTSPKGFRQRFGDVRAYNLTIHDCGTGIDGNGSSYVAKYKNCIVDCDGQNSNFVDFSGSFDTGTGESEFNFSSDTTAPNNTGGGTSKTFTFTDAANGDFSLSGSDTSGAEDGGTDLSADGDYAISIDITGTTRSGTWDAGAFEAAAAGGATVNAPSGTLGYTGQLPSVDTGVNIGTPSGSLGLTGQLPAIETGVSVATPAGTLTLTAALPSVETGASVQAPSGSLLLTAALPSVETGVSVALPSGTLTFSGALPTIDVGDLIVSPPAGVVTFSGLVPSIATGATVDVPSGSLLMVASLPAVIATAGKSGVNRLAQSRAQALLSAASQPTRERPLADIGRRRDEVRARAEAEQEARRAPIPVDDEGDDRQRPAAKGARGVRVPTSGRGIEAPVAPIANLDDDVVELRALLQRAEAKRRAMMATMLLYYAEAA